MVSFLQEIYANYQIYGIIIIFRGVLKSFDILIGFG